MGTPLPPPPGQFVEKTVFRLACVRTRGVGIMAAFPDEFPSPGASCTPGMPAPCCGKQETTVHHCQVC